MEQMNLIKTLIHSCILVVITAITAISQPYKLVVYNIENLFDTDGIAVYNDYKPTDNQGNPLYTPTHVYTKILNAAQVMSRYNSGIGPDIIMLVEIESDQTQPPDGIRPGPAAFLNQYKHTTLERMLTDDFDDTIADLPAELLLLKGFHDNGLTGYDMAVAYNPLDNGKPTHAVKNVIFSRLPIMHSKTRSHAIENARPILETWIDVQGHELILFNNHWKSGASDPQIELTRIQNAKVLRERIVQIQSQNPHADIIIGGDFNSDYNQSHRYKTMPETGINSVLLSVGSEQQVAEGKTRNLYNLWYEWPVTARGSDQFRGYWGTLMQIMISSGLYDYNGIQYVDNSFEVGRFSGMNAYTLSDAPIRWSFFDGGYGYSDHFPLSMRFTITDTGNPEQKLQLIDPSKNDDDRWSPIPVKYNEPKPGDYIVINTSGTLDIRNSTYFDRMFKVTSVLGSDFTVMVNNETYDLYSPSFNVRSDFRSKVGEEISFYGRLGMFRGRWQFVIDSSTYVLD